MPSGTYNNEARNCRICKRKLRPLKNQDDWDSRKYHITCFKELIRDIHNYHNVCYGKYGHKKIIAGIPEDQSFPKEGIIISFD